jgi:hypothetical protein
LAPGLGALLIGLSVRSKLPPDDIAAFSQIFWLNEFEKIERHSGSGGQHDIDNVDQVFAYWE